MNKYKDEKYRGYTINVCYDPYPESPREWSKVAKILSFSRSFIFDEHEYKDIDCLYADLLKEHCSELYDELVDHDFMWHDGITWYFEDDEVLSRVKKALENSVVIMPISCYSHGGSTIWLGHPNDKWDSGYVGVALQTKEDTIRECGADEQSWKEVAKKNIQNEVECLDQYIRGDVYGYIIEDKDGDQTGSCFGFFGNDGIAAAISEAKSIVDGEIRYKVMGNVRREPMLFTYEEMCGA